MVIAMADTPRFFARNDLPFKLSIIGAAQRVNRDGPDRRDERKGTGACQGRLSSGESKIPLQGLPLLSVLLRESLCLVSQGGGTREDDPRGTDTALQHEEQGALRHPSWQGSLLSQSPITQGHPGPPDHPVSPLPRPRP